MGASGAVNFVLGLSGKKVGIAYKERVEKGFYAVSIRGSATCKVHLGRLVNNTAGQFGGSGGGHDKACGAYKERVEKGFYAVSIRGSATCKVHLTIPKAKIGAFVKEMNKNLAKN